MHKNCFVTKYSKPIKTERMRRNVNRTILRKDERSEGTGLCFVDTFAEDHTLHALRKVLSDRVHDGFLLRLRSATQISVSLDAIIVIA